MLTERTVRARTPRHAISTLVVGRAQESWIAAQRGGVLRDTAALGVLEVESTCVVSASDLALTEIVGNSAKTRERDRACRHMSLHCETSSKRAKSFDHRDRGAAVRNPRSSKDSYTCGSPVGIGAGPLVAIGPNNSAFRIPGFRSWFGNFRPIPARCSGYN